MERRARPSRASTLHGAALEPGSELFQAWEPVRGVLGAPHPVDPGSGRTFELHVHMPRCSVLCIGNLAWQPVCHNPTQDQQLRVIVLRLVVKNVCHIAG
ncbi:hypothetical protein NDU88_000823 [Pleurodeles waltl]|uniref:Uncharacterized protein n=1 Tax=Pleurodeles waltl TaxID=8319 RepID=A0AAV7P1X9_PLEWA|nr:hypothetical protein NDU88_000823 [Pleurodeles waltl]